MHEGSLTLHNIPYKLLAVCLACVWFCLLPRCDLFYTHCHGLCFFYIIHIFFLLDDIHYHDHYTLSYGTIHAKSSSSSSGSDLPPIAQSFAGTTIGKCRCVCFCLCLTLVFSATKFVFNNFWPQGCTSPHTPLLTGSYRQCIHQSHIEGWVYWSLKSFIVRCSLLRFLFKFILQGMYRKS